MKTQLDNTKTIIIFSGAGNIYVTTPEPLSVTFDKISLPSNFYTVKLPVDSFKNDNVVKKKLEKK